MSCILGIAAFHPDASACLVVEGRLIAAVAEERLGRRIKHDPGFPFQAIETVLRMAGVSLADVTHIALARNPRANLGRKIQYVLSHPRAGLHGVQAFRKRRGNSSRLQDLLRSRFGDVFDPRKTTVVGVEHHLAHIASAYYVSPFDSLTAGFSYDGSGDFVSAMAARCEGTAITVLDKVLMPNSLGVFYSALCQFIGFDRFGEEYKVMGLAPYGVDNHREAMQQLLRLKDDDWFQLQQDCFAAYGGDGFGTLGPDDQIRMPRLFTDQMKKLLGAPRSRLDVLTQREKDISRSCQVRFEEASIHCMQRLQALVPTRQLAMAGGCTLNGVANARVLRETPFVMPYLQAAASDDGTSLGAAYWCYHNVAGGMARYHMQHAFWGPEYSAQVIKDTLDQAAYSYQQLEDELLFPQLVRLLRQGRIVGWYQGRSEWGPRALGNRSILADPTHPDMKNIINEKIKRRESFRPFAPSVLAEKVGEYFEQDIHSPFMMHVVKFKPAWRAKLPAVTHVDGTGRLQSVTREENPRYHELIRRFSEASGVGMLLNTSFNENEPIVDTPRQALDCYLRTDMDALCLGNMLLIKEPGSAKLRAV